MATLWRVGIGLLAAAHFYVLLTMDQNGTSLSDITSMLN